VATKGMATTIYIDADGCAVKDETYKVAARYQLAVRVVANHPIHIPGASALIQNVVVGKGFDEADDWIAERVQPGDIVVTADIPLAARCLKNGARALGPKGRALTEDSIGDAVASRDLSQQLREMGIQTGGPAPMQKKDRSRFLSKLDELVNAIRRDGA
jgi:uncharacterized protein YaiI (UPF0178 family)